MFYSCFLLSKCRCQDMWRQPSSWWQHPAEVRLNHIFCRCSISSNMCVCVSISSIYSESHLTTSSNFQPSYSQSSNAHLVITHQLEMYRWFEMSRQSQRSHPIHEIVHFIVKIHSKIPARISRIETDPPDKKHISFQNQLAHDSAGSRIR